MRNFASNGKEGGHTGCRGWMDKARGRGVEVEAGPNKGMLECCSCWILGGQTGRTGGQYRVVWYNHRVYRRVSEGRKPFLKQ